MKDRTNALLAGGMICITAGLVLLFWSFAHFTENLFFIRPVIILLIGCFILYRGLIVIKRALAVFIGMYMCCFGIIILLIDSGVTLLTMRQLWPSIVILCGVALVPSGVYKYSKLHPAYVIPALVLVLMGCFFMLFSFNIIKESFLRFAARWWPFVFIIAGLAMIGLFVYLKHNASAPFFNSLEEDEDID